MFALTGIRDMLSDVITVETFNLIVNLCYLTFTLSGFHLVGVIIMNNRSATTKYTSLAHPPGFDRDIHLL